MTVHHATRPTPTAHTSAIASPVATAPAAPAALTGNPTTLSSGATGQAVTEKKDALKGSISGITVNNGVDYGAYQSRPPVRHETEYPRYFNAGETDPQSGQYHHLSCYQSSANETPTCRYED